MCLRKSRYLSRFVSKSCKNDKGSFTTPRTRLMGTISTRRGKSDNQEKPRKKKTGRREFPVAHRRDLISRSITILLVTVFTDSPIVSESTGRFVFLYDILREIVANSNRECRRSRETRAD